MQVWGLIILSMIILEILIIPQCVQLLLHRILLLITKRKG